MIVIILKCVCATGRGENERMKLSLDKKDTIKLRCNIYTSSQRYARLLSVSKHDNNGTARYNCAGELFTADKTRR